MDVDVHRDLDDELEQALDLTARPAARDVGLEGEIAVNLELFEGPVKLGELPSDDVRPDHRRSVRGARTLPAL